MMRRNRTGRGFYAFKTSGWANLCVHIRSGLLPSDETPMVVLTLRPSAPTGETKRWLDLGGASARPVVATLSIARMPRTGER